MWVLKLLKNQWDCIAGLDRDRDQPEGTHMEENLVRSYVSSVADSFLLLWSCAVSPLTSLSLLPQPKNGLNKFSTSSLSFQWPNVFLNSDLLNSVRKAMYLSPPVNNIPAKAGWYS